MNRPRSAIPLRRKLLYAALVLAVPLLALQLWAMWLVKELPHPPGYYPSVEAYLGDVRGKVGEIIEDSENPWPRVMGPTVMLRVPEGTVGAQVFRDPGGLVLEIKANRLPGKRRVLLLGGSAAYGYRLPFVSTVSHQLQSLVRARPELSDVTVHNLGRPSWELTSVAALATRIMGEMSDNPPAALVIYSGNNEFLAPGLFGIGRPVLEESAVGRALLYGSRRLGWLRPPPDSDPDFFKYPDWLPMLPSKIVARIWLPARGVPDASHWPAVRAIHLDHFRATLKTLLSTARRRSVPLVLVPPPVNLFLAPGGVRYQPVTYRAVGREGYDRIAERLKQVVLGGRFDQALALVNDEPSGPVQHYLVAQHYEKKKKFTESLRHYREARDAMMGLLGSLPTLARIYRELGRSTGVPVVDTRTWYRANGPVLPQARRLFNDSCHLTAAGSKTLAMDIAPHLIRQLRTR